jgi:hypothetical protein
MPAPTLIATAGASDANSYASIAEANAYHEAHIHGAAWRTALDEDRRRALMTATRVLDQHVTWLGSATSQGQALQWPRTGVSDEKGYPLSSSVIPASIAHATAELARQLMAVDRTADSEIEAKGLTSLTVGPISMAFKSAVTAKVIPDAVWYLVRRWGSVESRQVDGPLRLVRA